MKKTKHMKITMVLILILGLFLTIGSGFATWVFYSGYTQTSQATNDKMDNILENYRFPDNIYTLYFFSQPASADNLPSLKTTNLGDDVPDYTSKKDDAWGFWNDKEGVEDVENLQYGYKKAIVESNLSSEQLNELGDLSIKRQDSEGWPLEFSGWTADRDHSAEYTGEEAKLLNKTYKKNAFTNMIVSDYRYADFTKDLGTLDDGKDGTDANDHIIFLYPVYTSGKSYNNKVTNSYPNGGSIDQLSVRLQAPGYKTDKFYNKSIPTKSLYLNQIFDDEQSPYNLNNAVSSSYRPDYKKSYFSYTGRKRLKICGLK